MTNRVNAQSHEIILHMPLCRLEVHLHPKDLHELVLAMHWSPGFREAIYDSLDQLSNAVEPKQYGKGWLML